MGAENEVEVTVVEEVFVDGQLAELVVIEEFAKRGERPPHAKTYVIRIDKETYHSRGFTITPPKAKFSGGFIEITDRSRQRTSASSGLGISSGATLRWLCLSASMHRL